jgi:hypothetical protein
MMETDDLQQRVERARELLKAVRHAAMATVNADGSPHNTPYLFMCSPDLQYLYWGSHPDSVHSQNVARTGQIFVVLYDSMERGGLYIRADGTHIAEDIELEAALKVHNNRRMAEGKDSLPIEYYQGENPQRMYIATVRQLWTVVPERDETGLLIRDCRVEITREQLLR